MIKLEKIPATPKDVRKFGLMFAGIGVLLAAFNIYRQGDAWPFLLGGAGLFLSGGLFAYPLLRPVYVLWMKFAFVLAWVNTRIILGIAFYCIVTPIGVVMRLFGKDSLGVKIERERKSYWLMRETPYEANQTKRQF